MGTDCNLADAFSDVALATVCIHDSRTENCWRKLWKRIDQFSSSVGIIINKPRTARVQRHCANSGATSVICPDYYQINVYYPFMDHVISELETRFSCGHEGLVAIQYLVPFHLPQLSQKKIDSLCSYYNKCLNYEEKEDLITDIMKCYEEFSLQERPNTANSALSSCSPQTFSTLHKVFTIFLTTPVGSVSCERSFSVLR